MDVLEALRSQAYPAESNKDMEKEIVQKFVSRVRDADVKNTLLTWSMSWDMSSKRLTVEQVLLLPDAQT